MTLFASVIAIVCYLLLVLLEAGQAAHTTTSLFELRRRKTAGDKRAAATLRREELLAQAGALKTPLKSLFIVGFAMLCLFVLGEPKGLVAAIVGILFYVRIARLGFVRKFAHALFARSEAKMLGLVAKYEVVTRLIGGRVPVSQPTAPLGSREELAHLLDVSHVFSDDDKKLLESVLSFSDRTVADVMTKKADMVTIKPSELLGPLVLDDLHKTKHEIFPVENNGEIVGMLDIRDHVALRRKESVYARDVMYAGVVRISETEPLDEALRVLIAAKQPYLIVINDDGEVAGMLGLSDVIRTLTGWSRR